MEFLKKNWIKITLAILSFVGLVLAIVTLAHSVEIGEEFMALAGTIGWFLFFTGMFAYYTSKLLKIKKYTQAWILVATGLFVSIFSILYSAHLISETTNAPAASINVLVLPTVMTLIVIGFFPLCKGIHELLKARERQQTIAE